MKTRAAACIALTFAAMATAADSKATPDEARKFVNDAEQKLLLLGIDAARADWIKSTYITDDTEAMAAKLDEKAIAATVTFAKQGGGTLMTLVHTGLTDTDRGRSHNNGWNFFLDKLCDQFAQASTKA